MTRNTTALIVLAGVALVAGSGLGLAEREVAAQTRQEREALKYAADLSLAFQRATKTIAPSVVNIVSTQRIEARSAQPRDPLGDLFGGDLFERFFGGQGDGRRFFEARGQGSGVIIRESGHILTNNHVVSDAHEIQVTLSNGRRYRAEVVGTDPETDLAVVRIDADDLVAARFGDSESLEVGQWVLAVGNPFGLDNTVTAGIVSAKGRSNLGLASYENAIQTDAAINPGNSGGPLVNLHGEVVGINTAITTRSGGFMGIGFAIPSNMARHVMEGILEGGRVVRGWLGVMIQPLTEDLAESFGYPSRDGVLITEVTAGGPAERAGLAEGDIVTELDGKFTSAPNDLRNAIARIAPGTTVQLTVVRKGREQAVEITLGERPPAEELAAALSGGRSAPEFGVTVQPLTPELAEQLGSRHREGVVVISVEQGSLADEAGIERGDVIIAFGDTRIRDLGDFRRAMEQFDPEQGVRIQIHRRGTTLFVILK